MAYRWFTPRWCAVPIAIVCMACAVTALAASSLVDDHATNVTRAVSSAGGTLTSPGMKIGITPWDRQHYYSNGHQVVASPGADVVHFAWVWWDDISGAAERLERYIAYNAYSISGGTFYYDVNWNPAFLSTSPASRAAFPRMDVGTDGKAHVVFHQLSEVDAKYQAWHLYLPILGSALYLGTELDPLTGHDGNFYPDVAVTQNPAGDIYHVIAMATEPASPGSEYQMATGRIVYYRFDAGAPVPVWEGPVLLDSSQIPGYVIDADDEAGLVAMAFHTAWVMDGLNELSNVAYLQSQTNGAGWIDGSEIGSGYRNLITSYDDEFGPQAWPHISIAYDHSSRLHIVFSEQRYANTSEQVAIRHWSSERGTVSTVAYGYYANPSVYQRSVNLDQVTLGIGDGATPCFGGAESNEDYLYVLYTKLGGETPEEQADFSAVTFLNGEPFGYSNGELYLTVSRDLGDNWTTPANLTNTKFPRCNTRHPDSLCPSEAWATIARDVGDINIFYMLDLSPGDVWESPWTINDAMYLRYPGGTVDAPYVCPECICPCHGDPQCDGIKNVLDVVLIVNEAFRNAPPLVDTGCPHISRCDMNCDCKVDILDVVIGVNYAFRWDITPVCDPCEESCP